MKRELEEVVRDGESPFDLVALLRGGPDGQQKILLHADRLEEIFTFQGRPARGISLFAAHGDLDAWTVLGGQLRSYPKYFRMPASALAERFVLLPTFAAPHWTLLLRNPNGLDAPETGLVSDLLVIIGEASDNPKWVTSRKRRR